MKPEEIIRAYKAIKDHVRTHVTGDADDLYCACQETFDRQKHKYDKKEGEIEDFAAGVAHCELANSLKTADNRKCREVEHYDSRELRHGEKREKKLVKRLVMKAWWKLTPEERGIIGWELCGLSLKVLQEEFWKISEKAFYEYHVNPARDAFAEEFGKVVGNPKWYAKLRAEKVAKRKGQKQDEQEI